MISRNLVLHQLSQEEAYISIANLAIALNLPISEVRQLLIDLGNLVESNDKDEWRVVRAIAQERLLTPEQRNRRNLLENTVNQSFCIAGRSLRILKQEQLYRETHATFDLYLRDRFGFTARAANYLITATLTVENLSSESMYNILPTNEGQCRPLGNLPAEVQRKAWKRAVELKKGKTPSAKIVEQAVKEVFPGKRKNRRKHRDEESSLKKVKQESDSDAEYINRGKSVDSKHIIVLDEETFLRLQRYQNEIGAENKSGAVERLLDEI